MSSVLFLAVKLAIVIETFRGSPQFPRQQSGFDRHFGTAILFQFFFLIRHLKIFGGFDAREQNA
jgi:hypothetical protein